MLIEKFAGKKYQKVTAKN